MLAVSGSVGILTLLIWLGIMFFPWVPAAIRRQDERAGDEEPEATVHERTD